MFMQNFNVVAPAVWLTHNFEWKCGEPHEKVLMKLINKLSSLKNRLILKHRYYSDFMYFWGKKSNLWYSSGKYDFSSVFFFSGLTRNFIPSIVKESLNFIENCEKSEWMQQRSQLLSSYDWLDILSLWWQN